MDQIVTEARVRMLAMMCLRTQDGEGYELCQQWLRDRGSNAEAKLREILDGRDDV